MGEDDGTSAGRRALRWYSELILVALVFAAALVLHGSLDLEPGRVLYESIAVFFCASDTQLGDGRTAAALWAVRCAAPLSIAAAVVDGLWKTVLRVADSLGPTMDRVGPACRDHVVVVGVGQTGRWLCHWLKQEFPKQAVVAVDQNAADPGVEQLRGAGVPVIIGDARDVRTLVRANVGMAKEMYLVVSDDLVNISAALIADELPGLSTDFVVWTQVAEPRLREGLVARLHDQRTRRMEPFSSYDFAAGLLVDRELAALGPGNAVVVAGLGKFGGAVLRALLAHDWTDDAAPKLVALDVRDLPKTTGPTWYTDYMPPSGEPVPPSFACCDLRGTGAEELLEDLGRRGLEVLFVLCTDDDEANLQASLRLAERVRAHGRHSDVRLFTRLFRWPKGIDDSQVLEGIQPVHVSELVREALQERIEARRAMRKAADPAGAGQVGGRGW